MLYIFCLYVFNVLDSGKRAVNRDVTIILFGVMCDAIELVR